jgi:Mn2+/Fe2+ NRAMP family transporter
MGEHTNSWGFNVVAWTASIIMIILTLVLIYTSIFEPPSNGLSGALLHHHFF